MTPDELHSTPVYAISVVAQLTGMHPQTLRQYDRLGFVTPQRTTGGGRRYSAADVDRLREIQQLSADGIGLAGIQRIIDLEHHVDALRRRVGELEYELDQANAGLQRMGAGPTASGAELVLRDRASLVVWSRRQRMAQPWR